MTPEFAERLADAACWRQHGVWGRQRPRCARLDEVSHCRNCEVFALAARRRFKARTLPELSSMDDAEPGTYHRGDAALLPCLVAGRWLGFPLTAVVSVEVLPAVHSLPRVTGGLIQGLAALQGAPVLMISLSALLGLEAGAAELPRHETFYGRRCLQLELASGRVAFAVERVLDPQRYYRRELAPVAGDLTGSFDAWQGVLEDAQGRPILVCDPACLARRLQEVLA